MKPFDLSTRGGRLRTYLHLLWNDHAYFRLGFSNAHWLSDELVRCNQPWPHQLAAWKARGIRTVINLRGGFDGSFYALEKEACAKLDLTLVDFTVTSRDVPTAAQIRGAKELFERIEYPAIMHCKSGADRAGLMSVLYMHFRQGQPLRQALKQLDLKYLHIRAGLTGIIDRIFELYLAEGEPNGLSLIEWVERPEYDPPALKKAFRAGRIGTLINEKILRRE